MKKRWNRLACAALALALCLSCLVGGTVLAAGDKNDPLVSLSYLEQTVLPDLLKNFRKDVDTKKQELSAQLDSQVKDYEQKLEDKGDAAPATGSAAYSVVTISKDQKLQLAVGCEVMLRVGTATVISNTEPGLIDVTTGGTLANGKGLEKNHLYMATIPDRAVKATAGTVKLLVRGEYTLG